MKIAVISCIDDSWGGSEELWYQMALSALDNGHKVSVSIRYTGTLAPKIIALQDKGLIVHKRRGYIPRGIKVWRRIATKILHYGLNKLKSPYTDIKKERPDIIVYNSSLYQPAEDIYFQKLLTVLPVPYIIINQIVAEFSKPFVGIPSPAYNKIYQEAAKVYFVSKRNQETAERQLCINLENAEVITNPVNLKDKNIIPFPALSNVQINFATVGNLLTHHKGQDIILAVLATDIWKNRNWQLHIYGKGAEENYLRALCTHYQLEDKVIFHGHVSDIRKVWQDAHMLLMCSLMEGLPLAVIEAMLCGRPVVTTDVGGNREIITDREEGFIADSPTTYAFNKALEEAWAAKERWESMGQKAHIKANGYFKDDIGNILLNKILNFCNHI